ncbi:MAG TPA: hypothetical protein DCL21_00270 [Alphaproteobacteria bacterium]|nr:hypothetical protein [Alphaproteobacteria bacterium]
MINIANSKANAKILVDRFLKSGEQPDFMERFHHEDCFVKANFSSYCASYVINKFRVYAAIASFRVIDCGEGYREEELFRLETCDFLCYGDDLVEEIIANSLDFKVKNGMLQIIKLKQGQKAELKYKLL